jgi:hypothetical protein
VQLRRVLLLFALVLGLSALVAALVPPPDEDEGPARNVQTVQAASPRSAGGDGALRFDVRTRPAPERVQTRRAAPGSRVSLEVSVPEPGDVTIPAVGLRQSGDPHAPARFDLLAPASGRYAVVFEPVRGPARTVARVAFTEPGAVRRRARGR